MADIA